MDHSDSTILMLFFLLLALVALLIFLYKKLNKDTNGEYTVRNMVYKEGGARDRLRGAAQALGTRLGVQLWPHNDVEMQEVRDEEAQLKNGDSRVGEEEEEEHGKAGEEEEDSETSDEESHSEGSEADEEARLKPESQEKEMEKKEKEKEEMDVEKEKEREREDQMKGEGSGGTEVLISINQFSGSAIWSEEQVGDVSEVTPL